MSDISASLIAGMAWATPVAVNKLGAHLEAYKTAMPKIQMLQFCNRFGQGSGAYIRKLPVELVKRIEEYVMDHWQKRLIEDWTRCLRCFEGDCELVDHLDQAGFDRLYFYKSKNGIDKYLDGSTRYLSGDAHEDRVRIMNQSWENMFPSDSHGMISSHDWDEMNKVHYRNEEDWRWRISQQDGGGFGKYDEILRRNFGLEAFITQTRTGLDNLWRTFQVTETTTCYLTLPKALITDDMLLGDFGQDDYGVARHTLAMIADTETPKNAMKRIPRAMKILDLKPFIHWSQLRKPCVANAPVFPASDDGDEENPFMTLGWNYKAKIKKLEESSWPKLLVLIHVNVDSTF